MLDHGSHHRKRTIRYCARRLGKEVWPFDDYSNAVARCLGFVKSLDNAFIRLREFMRDIKR